jgi:ribonuclease E
MPNKMLIDATHPEETRVVVMRGNRVEEFDFESANRKQLRGNIYLAKVTRVEPSLQAAFVDYGGNRHGFLAFSEIHPDYYQIPVADRQALIDEEERAQRAADAEADKRARRSERGQAARHTHDQVRSELVDSSEEVGAMAAASELMAPEAGSQEDTQEHEDAHQHAQEKTYAAPAPEGEAEIGEQTGDVADAQLHQAKADADETAEASASDPATVESIEDPSRDFAEPSPTEAEGPHVDSPDTALEGESHVTIDAESIEAAPHPISNGASNGNGGNVTEVSSHGSGGDEETIESVGGSDAMEEVPERTYRPRRQYKIQEVIKRRQVMLVQVVKEERGTKGAALTTYLSLAGRYSVLMPNTARGGGISRKITSAEDRRRLKEIAAELEVPEGMGVILRTAGASRTKTEVKRDFEYLLRLWETVRDLTLKSTAPTLVYEEGSLVKRSIRDLYNKDIDEIIVAGDAAHKEAKDFMRMLMPSHAKNVKPYRETLPIYTRYGIESQLDAMFQPVVQLRSGGYIVINQAEALVAIDVNSGRATREHHIEDTALKTNLESAEEVARQLRLRDLAGLIVIDFIDMDEKRNNRAVERRLKECLKHDRARIQVGHISHFGLLEMSRQRIRSSVLESSTDKCPLCGGTGHVRSVSSVSLQLLRTLEEMLLKGATHNVVVRTRTEIALYLLNHKRAHLRALEERFQVAIMVNADASINGQLSYVIDKGEQVHSLEQAKAIAVQPTSVTPEETEEDEETEDEDETAAESQAETAPGETARADGDGRRRRRRRRGRRGGEGREPHEGQETGAFAHETEHADADEEHEAAEAHGGNGAAGDLTPHEPEQPGGAADESERRRRRRGRRGGRRRRGREGGESAPAEMNAAAGIDADFDMPQTQDAEAPIGVAAGYDEQPSEHQEIEATSLHSSSEEQTVASESAGETIYPAPAAPAEIAEPAAARRRSTVREPAPVIAANGGDFHKEPSPPPAEETSEPVVSSSSNESEAQPRRSGWWSRRLLGKG